MAKSFLDESLLMIFAAFFDESGTSPHDNKSFVMETVDRWNVPNFNEWELMNVPSVRLAGPPFAGTTTTEDAPPLPVLQRWAAMRPVAGDFDLADREGRASYQLTSRILILASTRSFTNTGPHSPSR